MTGIPDFTETELRVVRSTLKGRYGKEVDIHLADTELRLDPGSNHLTECPTVFWKERGANFVICKVAEKRYYGRFFYTPDEHFGAGRDQYNDLAECVTVLLQAQADHEQERAGVKSGSTSSDIPD